MAAPVPARNQNQAVVPQAVNLAQPPVPAPAGVGAAPTTVQAAAHATPQKQAGYVETAVLAIRDFIIWLFSKIFFCFTKQEETKPQPAPSPPAAVIEQQVPPQPLPELKAELAEELKLLADFKRLDEAAQKRIYYKIGKEKGRAFTWKDYEVQGADLVRDNPLLLKKYLVTPIAQN